MAQVLLGIIAGPPEWPDLSWGSHPASYSCEVLVLVAAVTEFLRLRFVAIILMARSSITIATPIFFPSAVGRTPAGRKVLIVDVVGLGDQIERLADSGLYKNRSVRGGVEDNQRRFPSHPGVTAQ